MGASDNECNGRDAISGGTSGAQGCYVNNGTAKTALETAVQYYFDSDFFFGFYWMIEWYNSMCADDLSSCPAASIRDPNEKLMIQLNDLRTPDPVYYFEMLAKFEEPAVSSELLSAFVGFLSTFIDNGDAKDFHLAGYYCGRILDHIAEPDLGASDCPAV